MLLVRLSSSFSYQFEACPQAKLRKGESLNAVYRSD